MSRAKASRLRATSQGRFIIDLLIGGAVVVAFLLSVGLLPFATACTLWSALIIVAVLGFVARGDQR